MTPRRLRPLCAVALLVALGVAGCGSSNRDVQDSGSPLSMHMLAFAQGARQLTDETNQAALAFVQHKQTALDTRLYVARLGGEASRLTEEVERDVDYGTVARPQVIIASRAVDTAAQLLVRYTAVRSGKDLTAAQANLKTARDQLASAADALSPTLRGFEDELDILRKPIEPLSGT